MEKQTKMPVAYEKLETDCSEISLIKSGSKIGIFDKEEKKIIGTPVDYSDGYKVCLSRGYIVISDTIYGGSIKIYDYWDKQLIIDDYMLQYAGNDIYVAQDRKTGKCYKIDLYQLKETKKLPKPHDKIDVMASYEYDALMVVTDDGKKALESARGKITKYNLSNVTVEGNVAICSIVDSDRKYFVSRTIDEDGYLRFHKSKRYDSIIAESVSHENEETEDVQIVTCKNKSTIDIYEVRSEYTNLLFSMRCDDAMVTARRLKDNDSITQYEIEYRKGNSAGLYISRIIKSYYGYEIDTCDFVPSEKNSQIALCYSADSKKPTYIIDGKPYEDLHEELARKLMLESENIEEVEALCGGRYYYGKKGNDYVFIEIKNGAISSTKRFADVSSITFADNRHASIVSAQDDKKNITSISSTGFVVSRGYDDVKLIAKGWSEPCFYLVTKDGEKEICKNSLPTKNFKCYDPSTGMESQDPKAIDIFFLDTGDAICDQTTVIMNGKASNLKHERIEDLRGITLGGTSIVARFITATHVINYKGAKPSIIFTKEKNITPHMVNLAGQECELYQDENGNWYGPSEDIFEPIEYLVPEVELTKGTRKHLTNQE